MATEPTTLPEWVTDNPPLGPVDGTSGETAIVEPSAGKKGTGFLNLERVKRQDVNWLFNLIYLWVVWFKQQVNAMFSNLKRFIEDAQIIEDMVLTPTNLTNTLATRFADWKIEGYEIVEWAQNFVTVLETTITYNAGRCRDIDGWFTFSEDIYSMAGFSKLFRNGSYYTAGSGNDGVVVPSGILAASTWHFIFLVRLDSGNFDIMMDNNINGTNVIGHPNVTHLRRLSAHFYHNDTNGFTTEIERQYGDYFMYKDIGSYGTWNNTAAQAYTDITITDALGLTPPGIDILLIQNLICSPPAGVYISLWEKFRTAVGGMPTSFVHHFSNGNSINTERKLFIPASDRTVRIHVSDSSAQTIYYSTVGVIDKRTPWTS